jgi:hypothetical protein
MPTRRTATSVASKANVFLCELFARDSLTGEADPFAESANFFTLLSRCRFNRIAAELLRAVSI